MPIDGVQNYNITARNGSLSNVIAGTVLGVAGGFAAKQVGQIDSNESANIHDHSLIDVQRHTTHKKIVEKYIAHTKRTEH